MGNEAGRLCKLPRFTRVQKFKGGETSKTNHIKGGAFMSAVPSRGNSEDDDAPGDEGPAPPAFPPAAIDHDDGKMRLLPSPCKASSSSSHAGDQPKAEGGGAASSSAKCDGAELPDPFFPGRQITTDSERGDRPVIQDGETKLIRSSSAESGRPSLRHSQSKEGRMSFRSSSKLGCESRRLSKGPLRSDIQQLQAQGKGGGGGKPFPKRPMGCKLSQKTWDKLEELFRLMDQDGSNAVTREEAKHFFQGAFSNLSVDAMFNEVDTDSSGAISAEEFVKFWQQVRSSGYKEQDIQDELAELIEGGAWVDWKDGRETTTHEIKFPTRPIMCRLSGKAWKKCEELFRAMSNHDEKMLITRETAQLFFKGAWGNISADAMFNEVDTSRHGVINAKDFMNFWVQVKASGYKEKDMLEELENLMDGSPWVDWKDGRRT